MKSGAFRKQEDGAVAVIVALAMTVLLGMTAFAVDYGMMAACKQSMQNAVDAAALAAAAELCDKRLSAITPTAKEYCALNGYDPDDDDVTMEVGTTPRTVTVTLHRNMRMGFSAVLTGESSRTVSAAATAEATSIFGDCPYAMFASQRIDDEESERDPTGIAITGNDIAINGDIHSNSDISMQHAVLGPGVIATAVRSVNPKTTGWNSDSIAQDMPSFRSFESALNQMVDVVTFDHSVTVKKNEGGFQSFIENAEELYKSRNANDVSYQENGLFIYVAGNLTFEGNNSTAYETEYPIILVVEGAVDLNGARLNSDYSSPVYVMSKENSIVVNGGGASFTGILFAPKGDVTINGNDVTFEGSIVARNIRKAGGKTTVSYRENVDRFLPLTKVHLIE